ncbi:hypothetical protein [Desulforhopalus singaporensis]|uniref:Uncharacterized protein n=1 Tax=Desulforhopalus singaporensis TaxID=91360 RepID=A0A1H0VWD6_9BACT|nr:hypothetical protein [Desulforhopalus singaporensis]SDP82714.1 hypothetical protein SAMN05660330_04277 [Desulforhopalus singaporensis]
MISTIDGISEVLNSREKAISVWLLILVILGTLNSKFRRPILNVITKFFARKLLQIYCAMFVYISLVVLLLSLVNVWHIGNLGDTIKWGVLVAFVMLFNFKQAEEHNYFKSAFVSNFKILVVIEFIINLYVFSLPVEFFLVPFLAILGFITAIAESDKQYDTIKKATNAIVSFIGGMFLIYSVYKVIVDFQNFATVKMLESFYLPIALSITLIPFIYLVALYSHYEVFFIRLGYFVEDPIVLRYAKGQTILNMNLNLNKLDGWSKYVTSNWRFKEKQEVDDAILVFCNQNKKNI